MNASMITRCIARLKQRYSVGNCYDIEVQQQDGRAKAIVFKKNSTARLNAEGCGEYVIRTDRVDLDESTLSTIHRSLTTIEGSFRAMKSELRLRPNYHKCEEATMAHLFLSVLANQAIRQWSDPILVTLTTTNNHLIALKIQILHP